MPFLTLKEIRAMTPEVEEEKLTALRAELLSLRATSKAGGAIDSPARIKVIRKSIARILTVQKEKAGIKSTRSKIR